MAVGNLLTSLRANTEKGKKMPKGTDKPSRKSHSTLKKRIQELAAEKRQLMAEVQKLKEMQEEIKKRMMSKKVRKEKKKEEKKVGDICDKCGHSELIKIELRDKTIKICKNCSSREITTNKVWSEVERVVS